MTALGAGLRVYGAGLRGYGALDPRGADRRAADLFCTTMPGRPREIDVPGHAAHRFTLVTGGEALAAWDFGEGPTVVLTHGWNGHAAQLAPFVAPLVESGHYVIAFDHAGHGRSSGKRTNLREMADAIAAIARRVGPVRAIIGHSLGGYSTLLALAEGLRADRAALLSPAAYPREYIRRFAQALGLGEARLAGLDAEMQRRAGSREALDIGSIGARVQAKVLVVHDPADRDVPFSHGRAVCDAVPGARLVTASGLGHRRILADARVVREVVDFVSASPESIARAG